FGQVGLAVALHEGEIQRPPADADYRDPDQLLLEEELEHGHAPVEVVLQGKDVDPALVIAGDQVPAIVIQAFAPLDVPLGTAGQAHPATVECHPALGNADHYPGQKTLPGRDGQQCLEQRT